MTESDFRPGLDRFLEPPGGSATIMLEQPPSAIRVFRCGERIGKYVVINLLARSRHAHVYRAFDDELERDVTVKLSPVPRDHPSGADRRLVLEAQLLSTVADPRFPHVFELGLHDDHPFIALEFIPGKELQNHAPGGKLAFRETARIVADAARAVASAHRQGVVHQDIKPQNILVERGGGARLIDFGMARSRLLPEKSSASRRIAGTAPFMAPEQARGADTGPESDVFSLGATLYFLLTRRLPFHGDSIEEAIERACRCEFDRELLSTRRTPPRLADICLRAMAPEPERRFASADALADALDAFASGPSLRAWICAAGVAALAAISGAALLLM